MIIKVGSISFVPGYAACGEEQRSYVGIIGKNTNGSRMEAESHEQHLDGCSEMSPGRD